MNYFKNILFFFLLAFNTIGQENLILNGDFEEYWTCPDDETQIERCKNVYNPLYYPVPQWASTSDYFNECSSAIVGVPVNGFGYQKARSGKGYVGQIMMKQINSYYYEYIQLEFSEELIIGNTYNMTIYCNISDFMEYTSNNIQFKFVDENLDYITFLSDFMTPDYRNQIFFTDTVGWSEISFNYIAKGGENFVIIGNFDDADSVNFQYLYDLPTINNPFWCYFMFDDASLKEVNVPIEYPNVFTPNGDNVNDYFTILQGEEQVDKLYILNRWGNVVFESDSNFSWDGKDNNGNELTEGVYFIKVQPKYYQEEKKEQYHGMVHLIR